MNKNERSADVALAAGHFKKERAYWLKQLAGEPQKSSFPFDTRNQANEETPKLSEDTPINATGIIPFNAGVHPQLMKICKKADHMLHMLLTTGAAALLREYTGCGDILVGMPAYKQEKKGRYLNTALVIRNRLHRNITFKQLLMQVRQTIIEADEHQNYPIEILTRQLGMNFSTDDFPLFDVVIRLDNIHDEAFKTQIRPNITFHFSRKGDSVNGKIEYNPARYRQETIKRIAAHFSRLLETAVFNPNKPVSHIQLLSDDERKRLLYDINATETDYPRHKSIHQLFEEQVERVGSRTAVTGVAYSVQPNSPHPGTGLSNPRATPGKHPVTLTYSQLNRKADGLALQLKANGVKPGSIVALKIERSIEMIIAIMAILKTGSAYLPIELTFPAERIRYMLEDSGAEVMLGPTGLFETETPGKQKGGNAMTDFSPCLRHFIAIDADTAGTCNPGSDSRGLGQSAVILPADAPAYIIYTSGTTGNPKGVVTTHANVTRVVETTNYISIQPRDRVLQLSNYAFDGSVFDIYGALLNGAALAVIPPGQVLDVTRLGRTIRQEAITVFFVTTALFNTLVTLDIECFSGIRKVLFGGERVSVDHTRKALEYMGKGKIIHVYGPTESTVFASFFHIDAIARDTGTIPIGKPLANTRLYILDSHMQPVPPGVKGELYIGGEGVARGYLNRPHLTLEKFIKNPFVQGDKLYRSGDLAKWRQEEDAQFYVEFLGRSDQQVKIRGFRIELGEIERRLIAHPQIKEAVVLPPEPGESDKKFLSAYIVPAVAAQKIDDGQVKAFLSTTLPDYMIPSFIAPIEKIPLNANGKVDRKALSQAVKPSAGSREEYVAPTGETEVKLTGIWSEILGMDKKYISRNHNFFHLGGQSLTAAILLSHLHKTFHVKVSLAEIFQSPTIKELAAILNRMDKHEFTSIPPVELREFYPLSSAQKRLYILQQMEADVINYNTPQAVQLEGTLDRGRLEDAFRELIHRHESLRTSFEIIGEHPVQRIHPKVDIRLEYHNAADMMYTVPTASPGPLRVPEALEKQVLDFVRPFDLARPPLLRAALVQETKNRHMLVIDLHHIVTDGTSMGIFLKELMALYAGQTLPPIGICYKDFSQWQSRATATGQIKTQAEYWKQQFDKEIHKLDLPVDYPASSSKGHKGAALEFQISGEETASLNALASKEGVTLYMVLLALYNVFLSRVSNRDDIVVGTAAAGRPHADLHAVVGMFVNMLALRNFPRGEITFFEFLNQVKNRTITAFQNQDYQYEELVDVLGISREGESNPLFNTVFSFHNESGLHHRHIPEVEIPHLTLKPYKLEGYTSKFDLSLHAVEAGDNLVFTFEYRTGLFNTQTIHRLTDYFKTAVSSVCENPREKIMDIRILPDEEMQKLLYDFNDTSAAYPEGKTIHQLFHDQVEKTPDNQAVVFEDIENGDHNTRNTLTYRELNENAGQLAHILTEKGVVPDTIVGLLTHRSIQMITGIIGILKAGGAYLPIDPHYPAERIAYMLADSNTPILLTTLSSIQAPTFHGHCIDLEAPPQPDRHREQRPGCDCRYYPHRSQPASSPAYIIYTSGSTGRPKGVIIQHNNLVRLFINDKFQFDFNANDTWTMFHSYCFDFSVWEMYGALLYGGKLVLVPRMVARDAAEFLKLLDRENVTVLNQTPSAFNMLMDEEIKRPQPTLGIRYVIFGGEALAPHRLSQWHRRYPGTELINMYGITETTVHVTFKSITHTEIASGRSHIGRPIPTLRTYVLDRYLKLLPIGITGELFVAGDGLGRGYLNRPALTADRFVKNPYKTGERLYRTGDLVTLTAAGEMEYIGRNDGQVKIRGFRIEPGEIEKHLVNHPDIDDARVLASGEAAPGSSEKQLAAYIISPKKTVISALREYLLTELPDYMVPTYFVYIEKFPLTANGKIDKKALFQNPTAPAAPVQNDSTPRNRVEKKLARLWGEVLNLDPKAIGIHTDFFESGGHSIKATVLVSKIHETFDIKLTLTDFFATPTIAGLAICLENSSKVRYRPIESAPIKDYYPLSSAQKRLFYFQQIEAGNINYNMPANYILAGPLNRLRLEHTLEELIARHESLRTSFHIIEENPFQKIHYHVPLDIEYFQLPGVSASPDSPAIIDTIKNFSRPFDLSRPPLLRAGLAKISGTEHILMVDMHHIISDGISQAILIQDFLSLYAGQELPLLKRQYKDYSQWQNDLEHSGEMKRQETYWLSLFEGEIPRLKLPIDYPRPPVMDFDGDTVIRLLTADETGKLNTLALQKGATLNMILLGLFNILLAKCTGQEDIVVGVPTAGRRHQDLNRIIGMFVNIMPMRNFPTYSKKVTDFLDEVIASSIKAYENQDYQLDTLIRKLKIEREANRQPLFDVYFECNADENPENTGTRGIRTGDLHIAQFGNIRKKTRFDLLLTADQVNDEIHLHFEYRTKLFKPETIERIAGYFQSIVREVATTPGITISRVKLRETDIPDNSQNTLDTADAAQTHIETENLQAEFYF